MRRPRLGAAAGAPALRSRGRWERLPAIHAFRRSAGPFGSANVSRGRTGVRPKPSRRSTVLHRHYAFDNTGPRGSCKRFARRGPNEKRSEEHTSELQSPCNLVCRLLLEKKKKKNRYSLIADNS